MIKLAFVEVVEDLILVFGTTFMVISVLSLGFGGGERYLLMFYLSLLLIGISEVIKICRKIKEEKEKYQGGKE